MSARVVTDARRRVRGVWFCCSLPATPTTNYSFASEERIADRVVGVGSVLNYVWFIILISSTPGTTWRIPEPVTLYTGYLAGIQNSLAGLTTHRSPITDLEID